MLWVHFIWSFSYPFGNRSSTCPFGKNNDILLQIGNFHCLVRCVFWYVLAHITVCFYLFSICRDCQSRKNSQKTHIWLFSNIHTLCLIWEIFLSYWEFFHQNREKYILFFIGNGSFYGTRIYRQKNPCECWVYWNKLSKHFLWRLEPMNVTLFVSLLKRLSSMMHRHLFG